MIQLDNVKIESGFDFEGNEIVGTKTKSVNVKIQYGKFLAIEEAVAGGNEGFKGLLMLPSFKDMHIHLDKTYYGSTWKAPFSKGKSVKQMIALEQSIMPALLTQTEFRAEKIIRLLQSNGSDFARSHVNIEPTSGLKGLELVVRTVERLRAEIDTELVAFPQHGIFYTDSSQIMRDAAQMNVDYLGALDPYTIDGNIQRSLNFIIDLALEYNKGIDIHLHEMTNSGLETVAYLIEQVKKYPQLQNRTFISHAYILAVLPENQLIAIAEALAEAGIGIISTIPVGKIFMPIPTLLERGVNVMSGTDSVIDHWQPFGSGNMLEKANLMAQRYDMNTEFELSRCLGIGNRNILPLCSKGTVQWPKVGDEASFVLVDAACSAEAVARVPKVQTLFHKGKEVFNKKEN